MPVSPASDRDLAALLSRWLETDPASFRTFLDELAAGDPEEETFIPAFYARLEAALPQLSDRAASSAYLKELLTQFVRFRMSGDPATALRWAENWLLDDALDAARVQAIALFAESDPAHAISELARVQNPARRFEAVAAIGESYARLDPDAALAWGKAVPSASERMIAMNGVLSALAEENPIRAGSEFQTFFGQVDEAYRARVAADRAARPANAVDDAGGEEAPPEHSPDLEFLVESAEIITRTMAGEDPARARAWVEVMPENFVKTTSARALLSAWAEQDAPAALAYFEQHRPHDADAVGGIFSAWAERDPATASQQATRVQGLTQRRRALEAVTEGWVSRGGSADEISRWGERLSEAADRDTVQLALAASLDPEEPLAAWRHATKVSRPEARGEALRSAFVNLAADEPERAAAELRAAGNLTAEERSRLVEALTAIR